MIKRTETYRSDENGFLDDADSLKSQLTEVRQWVVRTAMGEDTTAEELARIIYTLD